MSPSSWQWGQLHHLELENQSLGQSDIGLVRALFNRGPFEVGGGSAIVDATSWDAAEGYEVTSAPSMRMVVDLGDLDRSRWINLTGESGHVASGNYRDQTPLWVEATPCRGPSASRRSSKATDHRLVLEPSEDK